MINVNWPTGYKKPVLTVNGGVVEEELRSLTYTDDLNGDSASVMLGSTTAAQIVFVIDSPHAEYAGAEVSVSVGGVPLGVFAVTKTERRGSILTVTAMDAMAGEHMLRTYTPDAAATALGVIREIAAATGLAMADTGEITDVAVTPEAGLTRRDMLGRMAALLGKNAHIDRYGRLALRWYEDTGYAVTADDYYTYGLSMEDADYALARLECSVTTTVQESETDENGDTTASETVETTVLTAGSGTTGISIANEYMTQTALDAVYAAIGGTAWRPATVTFYGDARVECGDIVHVTDDAGKTHSVPVMRVEHIWDGGVKTTVTAVGNPSEALGSSGGTLSKAVDNLELEFARFRNLEAENLRAQNAKLARLEAEDISADRIRAGTIRSEDGKSSWNLDEGEIVLLGPDSEVFEQSAHFTDANILWFANDGSGFGARGSIGMAEGFPTLHPDPDGYLHMTSLLRGKGIRFGYDGGTVEKWFDMDYAGLEAYKPIYLYNEDESRYVPVNYDYAKAWYTLVKQETGEPQADATPQAGSMRALASGAMYPTEVTSAVTRETLDGVTWDGFNVYTVGKMVWVRGQVTLTAEGVFSSWTTVASGLPAPVKAVYDVSASRAASAYYRPLDIQVTADGTMKIRYGAATGGRAYMFNLAYAAK